jgi:hypothetical protein
MGTSNNVFDKHIYMNMYSTKNYWLITPEMTLNEGAALSFDIAYTAYSTDDQLHTGCTTHRFAVLISTDNMATWTILREWNNSGSTYVLDEVSQTGETVNDIDISSYAGQTVYIAFFGHSETTSYDNNFHFDNVTIGTAVPATAWQTVTPNPTTATTTITGLTAETPYEVKVKGLCNGGAESEESDIQSFTTTIACPAPTTLVVAANATDATTMVDLTWAMGSAETAWQICVNGDEENLIDINESAVSINNNTVSYTLTGLIPGQDYTFKVRANCEASVTGDGTSDWSNTVSIQTEATCTEPTAFNHGTPDVHSVDLTWTESGTATQWQLCVNNDMDNLILLSSTDDDVNVDGQNVSYTLSGLTGMTNYSVKVRTYCAAGDGNQSPWVGPTEFRTACETITTFPWSENFESYTSGDFNAPCWVNEHITGNGTYIFKISTSSLGGNSTHQLQLPDMSNGTMTKLVLPEMTLNGNYQFVLDVYRNTTAPDYQEGIRVYASANGEIDDDAEEIAFISRSYTTSDDNLIPAESAVGWYTYELPIPITSGTCYIILRGESKYGSATYMDNFVVEVAPTCRKPKTPVCDSKTAHTATLSWTNGEEGQDAWQIAYSTDANFTPDNNFTPDGNTTWLVNANTNPFTINGLNANTPYRAYVRANCGTENGLSNWSVLPANFTTLAGNLAPTAFHTTDLQAEQVTMDWTPAGNDNETSWTILLHNEDIANINTLADGDLPSTDMRNAGSHPTVITGLTPSTTYYAWIRSDNQADGVSSWVAITGNTFTTTSLCPQPTDVVASEVTNNSANISWDGHGMNEFTVRYRTAEGIDGISEEFSTTQTPTGWEKKSGLLSEALNGTAPTSTSSGWVFSNTNVFGAYHAKLNIYGTSCKYWLITPEVILNDGANALAFDLALTSYNSANAILLPDRQADDKFAVLISTDDGTNWVILREWNNSGSEYIYNNIATAGEHVSLDLSGYSGAIKIAFYGESTVNATGEDNDLHIDNVVIGATIPAGNWASVPATDATETSISPLTENTKYEVVVSPSCDVDVVSTPVFFTTASLFTKDIVANQWYAIASPVYNSNLYTNYYTQTIDGMTNLVPAADEFAYDLFRYNEANNTWENYKEHMNTDFTELEAGHGYIYRRSEAATLNFVGTPISGTVKGKATSNPYFSYASTDADLKGFNLMGNPYNHDIYKGTGAAFGATNFVSGWFELSTDGTWQTRTDNEPIAAGTAALVKVSTSYASWLISDNSNAPTEYKSAPVSVLSFTVSNSEFKDVVYARFADGEGLNKVSHLNENAPMLSIPMNGSSYAIAMVGYDCQSFPVAFRGQKGQYTLTVNAELANVSYCHLIDRATGRDIDMLQEKSYTFTATGNDADRFEVKLSPEAIESVNGHFVYWNGSVWMVEGNGTLEAYDVTGRMLFSSEVNDQLSVSNSQFPSTGVYVLRMGNKSQKIVIR